MKAPKTELEKTKNQTRAPGKRLNPGHAGTTKKLRTIDEVCGVPAGSFAAFVQSKVSQ